MNSEHDNRLTQGDIDPIGLIFFPEEKHRDIENKFRERDGLIRIKFREYLPSMLMTTLSTLLLLSVDGLVVGNFVGADALSSVNIFGPITIAIGILSCLVSNGAAIYMSSCMGRNDMEGLVRAKHAVKVIMIVAAIVIGIVQFPIAFAMIKSYHLSPEMEKLTYNYAIGVLISMPFGMISTIGVNQLQIVGKMKVLMALSLIEGGVNLALDLLFVGPLHMGVAGAGYGTCLANVIRCTCTVVYLAKKTDIYKTDGIKAGFKEYKELLSKGLPEAASVAMHALQNYFIMRIILSAFGEGGGTIKGVCAFSLSMATVFISGTQGAMRPLTGIFCGGEDWGALRRLLRLSASFVTITVGLFSVFVALFPEFIFKIHGVKKEVLDTLPDGSVVALQIYAACFIFKGINTLFRLYFSNRKYVRFTTTLTVIGNATLPVFALAFSLLPQKALIWTAYVCSEAVMLIVFLVKYIIVVRGDIKERNKDATHIYLSVPPKLAIEASRRLRREADEAGINPRLANRLSLCMEEMVAYAAEAKQGEDIRIQIRIRVADGEGIFMMLDDGQCISLDTVEAKRERVVNNYEIIKRIAYSVQYQYVLNMNYTVLKIKV